MSIDASSTPRTGPRPSTSRAEIVQCTLRMLDREGPEALTFRAVARELGITVGALSRYFKNLADLEDEVTAQILSALRPFNTSKKQGLREQLLRFGTDLLEMHSAHPYLLKLNGPASAAVIGQHMKQSLNALIDAGLDLDRALALYSMVANLPYAWGVQASRQQTPELLAQEAAVMSQHIGDLFPKVEKLLARDTTQVIFNRWLLIYIDAMLAGTAAAKP